MSTAAAVKIGATEFIERSKSDRSFYFENAIKIRPKQGKALIPFILNPGQRRLSEILDRQRAEGKPGRVVILKARQIGYSTWACMESLRRAHVLQHQQGLIASYDKDQAETLFQAIERAWENLPKPIRPKRKYATKNLMQFDEQDSRIQVVTATEGRGFTAQFVHISELAFIENAREFMTGIMQTAPEDPDCAVIVESTPNGIGNEFHNLWVSAKSPASDWTALFIPWFEEPSYCFSALRRKPSFTLDELKERQDDAGKRAVEIMNLHGVSLDQIAWWLHILKNKCNDDLDVMEQEYPTDDITCFMASGSKVFTRDGLQHYVSLSGINPETAESPEVTRERMLSDTRWHTIEAAPGDEQHPAVRPERGGRLWISRHPFPKHKYIVAFDLSGGDPGSDHTPGVVLNRHTMNLDAVMDMKAPPEVCALYAALVGWYYNRATTFGEANNHGILFHPVLMDKYKYPNVYMRRTSEASVSQRVTDKPGFYTQGENREHLFNLVRRYVREKIGLVEHPGMVLEWIQLVRDDKTKRIDHPEGGTSDYTIAFGMALAVHAGSFDATLSPLTLEEKSALESAWDRVREARAFGRDISDIDLGGLTVDDADRLHDMIEKRDRRRAAAGLGGAV